MCKPKELSRKQKIKMKAEINKMVNQKKKKKGEKLTKLKAGFVKKFILLMFLKRHQNSKKGDKEIPWLSKAWSRFNLWSGN